MKLALFATLLISFGAFSFDADFEVQVRDGKKLAIKTKTLEDFKDVEKDEDKAFDGKYFKIVLNTENEAIKFNNEDQELVFRAATVYYHMTVAREYFNKLDLNYSNKNKQITVRVDVNKQYSNAIHFANREECNGAKTIPASNMFSNTNKVKELYGGDGTWGDETWFFKAKKVKRPNPIQAAANYVDSREFKNMLLGQMLYQDMISISSQLITEAGLIDGLTMEYHLYSMLFSIGLTEVIPKAIKLLSKLFKQKYYLDTALIPEIIYHEYAHIALGDIFGYKSSRPLNEGFPNYFAHKISGLDKLGGKARKHNKGDMAKSGNSKTMYSYSIPESIAAAHGSFTFSLLKQTDEVLGEDGENILVEVVKQMNTRSSLKSGYNLESFYRNFSEPIQTVYVQPCNSYVCILNNTVSAYYTKKGVDPLAKELKIKNLLRKRGL